MPLQGLLRSANQQVDLDATAKAATDLRNGFFGKRLFETRAYNQVQVSGSSYPLADKTKFLATVFSGGLNLSRHGSQRLNLNGMGFEKADLQDADVLKQVQRVVETIRFHAPSFSQRFYHLSPEPATANPTWQNAKEVAVKDQDIYLYKVAANIRDFIDPDLQPTIIVDSKTLAPRKAPVSALNDEGTAVWAQGKDSGPFIQEAACRYRTTVSAAKSGGAAPYDLKVDYYIEFWNMTTKDIYASVQAGITTPHALGSNAFLRISNQQAWLTNSGGLLKATNSPAGDPIQDPTRDMVIDLNSGVFQNGQPVPKGVVFKAGACTVITTDPDYMTPQKIGSSSPAFSGNINLANTYYCSNLLNSDRNGPGKREYTGTLPTGATGIKPDFRDGTQDYDTEVILGNDLGLIESHPAAIAMGGSPILTSANAPQDDWYGGSLLGNGTTPSELGDPRTNNEQLVYTRFLSGASTSEPDQTRYFNTTSSPRFSLGAPNDTYVNPQLPNAWPDYYKGWSQTSTGNAINPDQNTAPAIVANGNLTSIGQLGDVFDPARVKGTVGSLGIGGSRGGGRTFRIGQKDDLADTTHVESATTGLSQEWASWRLPDFLSTTSDIQLPGLININGVRRDNGAALRAACYGMTVHSVSRNAIANSAAIGDPQLDSTEYTVANPPGGLQRLINQAITRLQGTDVTKPTYFRERGEISDLAIFSSAISGDLVTGVKMSEAFDHTREEFVRRLIDLTTTRGNIFSVYAIGQSVTQRNDAAKTLYVTGVHEVKVTFALVPKKADGTIFQTTQETFDPTDQNAIKQRFAKPDHYDIQFLQVAYPQSHP